jgi:DNA-binding transcriptional LysR family regulator
MKEIDRLALDGHLLRLFLAVLDEGSVTGAAARLELTQSAVSHALTRLSALVGETLFVKSGRGIAPTAHALSLRGPARQLLAGLQGFGARQTFDPTATRLDLTVAANDLQRDLLLPGLFRALENQAAETSLRVIPSEVPSADLLREGRCDLLISPFPPEGTDIMQRPLLRDHYVCFYDPESRQPPQGRDEYLAARHVTVVYPNGERLDFDRRLHLNGIQRDFAVTVPSFSGVPAFLRGTPMLATLPSLLRANLMRDVAVAPVPLPLADAAQEGALSMMMVWHRRFDSDPQHRWLRRTLLQIVTELKRTSLFSAPVGSN